MSRIRILFLGTPNFALESLKALAADSHYEIMGVVSQPDRPAGRQMKLKASPVKEFALQKGYRVWTPDSAKDPAFLAEVKELGAECAVVVAYGQILKKEFLESFPLGCVNVHGSLLPRWRGAAPIQRALMAGDTETGVCLQIMVAKLDAGAVLGERRLPLDNKINAQELHDKLAKLSGELLHLELMDYLRGNLTPIAQDEQLVTYAKKIEKAEAMINWNLSSDQINNQVRGLAMGPYAFTTLKSQSLKIHQVEVLQTSRLAPGEVSATADGIEVGCGKGSLRLLVVQPESRSRMSAAEFLRGHAITSGDRFTWSAS